MNPAAISELLPPIPTQTDLSTSRRLLAGLALGPIALYLIAIIPGATHFLFLSSGSFLGHAVRGILVLGFVFSLWLCLVLTRVSGWTLSDLNLRRGKWWKDIALGLGVFAGLLLWQALVHTVIHRYFSFPSSQTVTHLNQRINSSLLMFLFWIGPRVWLGAAIPEELTRTFFLSHYWRILPTRSGKTLGILTSGILFGLLHIYQGWGGVMVLTCVGFAYAFFYERIGRVWPLIVAHGLVDDLFHTLSYLRAHGIIH